MCWDSGRTVLGEERINTLGWDAVGVTELESGVAQIFEGIETKGLGFWVG